jgi:hypothetical protein
MGARLSRPSTIRASTPIFANLFDDEDGEGYTLTVPGRQNGD